MGNGMGRSDTFLRPSAQSPCFQSQVGSGRELRVNADLEQPSEILRLQRRGAHACSSGSGHPGKLNRHRNPCSGGRLTLLGCDVDRSGGWEIHRAIARQRICSADPALRGGVCFRGGQSAWEQHHIDRRFHGGHPSAGSSEPADWRSGRRRPWIGLAGGISGISSRASNQSRWAVEGCLIGADTFGSLVDCSAALKFRPDFLQAAPLASRWSFCISQEPMATHPQASW